MLPFAKNSPGIRFRHSPLDARRKGTVYIGRQGAFPYMSAVQVGIILCLSVYIARVVTHYLTVSRS